MNSIVECDIVIIYFFDIFSRQVCNEKKNRSHHCEDRPHIFSTANIAGTMPKSYHCMKCLPKTLPRTHINGLANGPSFILFSICPLNVWHERYEMKWHYSTALCSAHNMITRPLISRTDNCDLAPHYKCTKSERQSDLQTSIDRSVFCGLSTRLHCIIARTLATSPLRPR